MAIIYERGLFCACAERSLAATSEVPVVEKFCCCRLAAWRFNTPQNYFEFSFLKPFRLIFCLIVGGVKYQLYVLPT